MSSYDIHLRTDHNGHLRASVTDARGRKSQSLVLTVGQRFAIMHILSQIKALHELDVKEMRIA